MTKSERKFIRKWLGALVFSGPGRIGTIHLITAVDVIRQMILIEGQWVDPAGFERLKPKHKKHWNRRTEFVNN